VQLQLHQAIRTAHRQWSTRNLFLLLQHAVRATKALLDLQANPEHQVTMAKMATQDPMANQVKMANFFHRQTRRSHALCARQVLLVRWE
jgi:hypothetical protein